MAGSVRRSTVGTTPRKPNVEDPADAGPVVVEKAIQMEASPVSSRSSLGVSGALLLGFARHQRKTAPSITRRLLCLKAVRDLRGQRSAILLLPGCLSLPGWSLSRWQGPRRRRPAPMFRSCGRSPRSRRITACLTRRTRPAEHSPWVWARRSPGPVASAAWRSPHGQPLRS